MHAQLLNWACMRQEAGPLFERRASAGGSLALPNLLRKTRKNRDTSMKHSSHVAFARAMGLKCLRSARARESAVAAGALPAQSKTRTDLPGASEWRGASWTAAGSEAPRRFRADTGPKKTAVDFDRPAPSRRSLSFGASITLKMAKNSMKRCNHQLGGHSRPWPMRPVNPGRPWSTLKLLPRGPAPSGIPPIASRGRCAKFYSCNRRN
jgi:hypothetical protein